MSDNQPRKYRSIASDYFNFFTTRLRRTDAQYDAQLYLNAVPFLLMSMVMVIALHDLFSMFLLRSTKSTCRLMAWGGVGKIVFIRWMLLIPAIFFTVLFTSFFATLALKTCDDGDKFCIIELLNYKMIFVGIVLGLFAMAIFYAWKRRKEGSVEYLLIASLMDPKGDGRSKFLTKCKNSKDFKNIVGEEKSKPTPTTRQQPSPPELGGAMPGPEPEMYEPERDLPGGVVAPQEQTPPELGGATPGPEPDMYEPERNYGGGVVAQSRRIETRSKRNT